MRNCWMLVITAVVYGQDHEADRKAIREHIDTIFQAYINKDVATIRNTHSEDWRGFKAGAREIIRGIDGYMKGINPPKPGAPPYGMKSYQMVDIDIKFPSATVGFVSYIADVYYHGEGNPHNRLTVVDLYEKRDGHWIQTASNTSLHPDSIAEQQDYRPLSENAKAFVLKSREAVWRAFFTNDRKELERLVPEETITIDAGTPEFGNRAKVLAAAEEFAKSGGKLVRLEFPRTEFQTYGNVVIVYTTYLYELEDKAGKRSKSEGRATEIFVQRNGVLVNSGWHLDSGS